MFLDEHFFLSNISNSSNDNSSENLNNSTNTNSLFEKISNYFLFIFLIISFFINLIIILIHKRQSFFRQGFFKIVFVQIILEECINLSSIIMKLIYMFDITRGPWFFIFPIIFNFSYVTNILYNIRIIYFLKNYDKTRDEEINYDIKDGNSNSSYSHQGSISLDQESFKNINIFSFSISIIYIIAYIIYIFTLDQKIKIESEDWKWYYYYLVGEDGSYWMIFFFSIHIFYIFVSVPYFFKSMNKGKVTNNILLKNYSIYGVLSSIVSLLFPITFLVNKAQLINNFHYIISFGFLGYIFITCFYRIRCYYIKYILESERKGFFNRCIFGFRILFCCQTIKEPNFIDLNSSFIFHSLANVSDFLREDNASSDELLGESK